MKKWKLTYVNGKYIIENINGDSFEYNPQDGIQILEDDFGYAYLDLNGNGRIDRFEDWHLPIQERLMELKLNLV